MSFILGFLVTAAIYGAVLSMLPWVKHKGFGACFAVAAIMALCRMALAVLALPVLLSLAIFSAIPVIGWMTGPLLLFLLSWLVNTVALYAADQAVADFEIKTLKDTAVTALVTSFVANFLMGFLGM